MLQYLTHPLKQLAVFLHAANGVGPRTILSVLECLPVAHGSMRDFRLQDLVECNNKCFTEKQYIAIKKLFTEHSVCSYWEWLQQQQIRVVARADPEYPARLLQLPDPPLFFYSQGIWPIQQHPVLAVVGSRRCTPYGIRATNHLIAECHAAGVGTIASGLMYGIDEAAHQAALRLGMPTVAVLGYGFGAWFPKRAQRLAKALLQAGGTLVSEYPPGMPPNRGMFLQRNRLVAALADAVLVPEAAERSGTQRTVAVAAELGVPVGAVPGAFDSPFSQGTKALVNQGALLVTSAQDILTELGLFAVMQQQRAHRAAHPIEQLLQAESMTTDELCLTLQQSVVQLSFELSSLEMAGRIVRRGGRWYRV